MSDRPIFDSSQTLVHKDINLECVSNLTLDLNLNLHKNIAFYAHKKIMYQQGKLTDYNARSAYMIIRMVRVDVEKTTQKLSAGSFMRKVYLTRHQGGLSTHIWRHLPRPKPTFTNCSTISDLLQRVHNFCQTCQPLFDIFNCKHRNSW